MLSPSISRLLKPLIATAAVFTGLALAQDTKPPEANSSSKTAAASAKLTQKEKEAFVVLVMGPKDNPVKTCVNKALYVNYQMTLIRDLPNVSEADLNETFVVGMTNSAAEKTFREGLVKRWQKGENQSELVYDTFNQCMAEAKIDFPIGNLGATCFTAALIPARAELFKLDKKTSAVAKKQMKEAYGKSVDPSLVDVIVDDVYAEDVGATKYAAHRRAVANCVMFAEDK